MKYIFFKYRRLSFLAATFAILAIVSSIESKVQSVTKPHLDGSEVSPTFVVPPKLTGDENLKVKDGDYSLGQWRTSHGVVEFKIAVRGGKKTDAYIALNGKHLRENTEPIPKKVQDYAKKVATAGEQHRTLFDVALDSFVQPVYADATHCHCESITIIEDCYNGRCHYYYICHHKVCGGFTP